MAGCDGVGVSTAVWAGEGTAVWAGAETGATRPAGVGVRTGWVGG